VGSLRKGLARTRNSFFGRIASALGRSDIDDDTWDEIEAMFLQADVGVPTTLALIDRLQKRGITRTVDLNEARKEELRAMLTVPTPLAQIQTACVGSSPE
jgi:fused signal recognition particle receptor